MYRCVLAGLLVLYALGTICQAATIPPPRGPRDEHEVPGDREHGLEPDPDSPRPPPPGPRPQPPRGQQPDHGPVDPEAERRAAWGGGARLPDMRYRPAGCADDRASDGGYGHDDDMYGDSDWFGDMDYGMYDGDGMMSGEMFYSQMMDDMYGQYDMYSDMYDMYAGDMYDTWTDMSDTMGDMDHMMDDMISDMGDMMGGMGDMMGGMDDMMGDMGDMMGGMDDMMGDVGDMMSGMDDMMGDMMSGMDNMMGDMGDMMGGMGKDIPCAGDHSGDADSHMEDDMTDHEDDRRSCGNMMSGDDMSFDDWMLFGDDMMGTCDDDGDDDGMMNPDDNDGELMSLDEWMMSNGMGGDMMDSILETMADMGDMDDTDTCGDDIDEDHGWDCGCQGSDDYGGYSHGDDVSYSDRGDNYGDRQDSESSDMDGGDDSDSAGEESCDDNPMFDFGWDFAMKGYPMTDYGNSAYNLGVRDGIALATMCLGDSVDNYEDDLMSSFQMGYQAGFTVGNGSRQCPPVRTTPGPIPGPVTSPTPGPSVPSPPTGPSSGTRPTPPVTRPTPGTGPTSPSRPTPPPVTGPGTRPTPAPTEGPGGIVIPEEDIIVFSDFNHPYIEQTGSMRRFANSRYSPISWLLTNTPPSGETQDGPMSDFNTQYTTQDGFYVYINGDTTSRIAKMLSPTLETTAEEKCLYVWYYIYGDTNASLTVDIVFSPRMLGVPRPSLELQGRTSGWTLARLTLPADRVYLEFLGYSGDPSSVERHGGLALDNIIIARGPC